MLSFLAICYPIGMLLHTLSVYDNKDKREKYGKKAERIGVIFLVLSVIFHIGMGASTGTQSQGVESQGLPLMWSYFILFVVYGVSGLTMVVQGKKYQRGRELILEDPAAVSPVSHIPIEEKTPPIKEEQLPIEEQKPPVKEEKPPVVAFEMVECANCGATNKIIGKTGECEYCGSLLA